MALTRSPLAPVILPELPVVAGVSLATAALGLRYRDRPDVLLMHCVPGTVVAGVFTQSTTRAVPVDWCEASLRKGGGHGRALLVNAGQANCFVGEAAQELIDAVTSDLADRIGCNAHEIFVASTGVIGQPVPLAPLQAGLPMLYAGLKPQGWLAAAQAIGTTDTYPKLVTRTVPVEGVPVTINAIAKGSGMIAPNMATMLGFVFTDLAIDAAQWQALLSDVNRRSFNCITVDGDASTNDTVLAFATGQAPHAPIADIFAAKYQPLREAFESLMIELAQQIVRDGEGAQKLVTISVTGAVSDESAHRMAMDIANSPLVKTAIAGEDANWGRLVMAVGKSGEPVDKRRIAIAFGPHEIARDGVAVTGYDEAPVAAYMKQREITLHVVVGSDAGRATVWTCDLTAGYITINADYRS